MYIAKLEELKKLGDPIEQRAAEDQARPGAVAALRSCAQGYQVCVAWWSRCFLQNEGEREGRGRERSCTRARRATRSGFFFMLSSGSAV